MASAAADQLSDRWREVLGYRPLALTRVAGGGAAYVGDHDGEVATDQALNFPVDAALDAAGGMYVTSAGQNDQIFYVPAADRGPLLGHAGPMAAGHLYAVAGIVQSEFGPGPYNAAYAPYERYSALDPTRAPGATFRQFRPGRLALEPAGSENHLLYCSAEGHRVLLLAGADLDRYGRHFLGGHLYTLAGTGEAGHGQGAGWQTPLAYPVSLAVSPEHDVYLLDGSLHVLRALDGQLVDLPATLNGQPLALDGATDVRLDHGSLYVADAAHHTVLRATVGGPTLTFTVALGQRDRAGFVDGCGFSDIFGVAAGVPQDRVLLDHPMSLAFDADGRMLVADAHGLRLVTNKAVYNLAGAEDAASDDGDVRQQPFPETTFLSYDPTSRTALVVDRRLATVRRLWSARGLL